MNEVAKLHFPIIGIGASAGGLKAIESFFSSVPKDCGMAFIVIVHLMKHRKSELHSLIAKFTALEVFEITDGLIVNPNTVYITPPDNYISLKNDQLFISKIIPETSVPDNIDFCFTSLSNELQEKSICLILSGSLSDGTESLKSIKDNGGMIMVQSMENAQFNEMPSSAINTGMVDYVLPAEEMYQKLKEYISHSYFQENNHEMAIGNEEYIHKIFLLLHELTGHDFSSYKKNTIQRRINKRMAVFQYENISDYYQYLKKNKSEVELLFNSLLIGVTSFFRDPDVFEKLKDILQSKVLEKSLSKTPVRIWVPACSTGEEAYTIAIILCEISDQISKNFEIKIFATDISLDSIEIARQGVFLSSLLKDLPEEIKRKYFESEGQYYRINKKIRSLITFAVHNIIKDPPFSKLDLVSCRNLMIYFDPSIQNKAIKLFHYALNSGGILLLGTSETIGKHDNIFSTLDKKRKIFLKKSNDNKINNDFSSLFDSDAKVIFESDIINDTESNKNINLGDYIKKSILENYSPVCVIINSNYDVLYIHGKSGKYFEPPIGEARWNIFDISKNGLKDVLRTGIFKAKEKNKIVNYYSVEIKTEDISRVVDLEIKSIDDNPSINGMIMIIIKDITNSFNEKLNNSKTDKITSEVKELQKNLSVTKEYLETIIEEYETSNEELKSTNEELQSTNEELQSTNEEVETSKEELQSTNEELQSLISEHQSKIGELVKLNNDMINLMGSTNIATIFLDNNLQIKRVTPEACKFFNILSSDTGRPITHFVSNLKYNNLTTDIQTVFDTLEKKEIEVYSNDNKIYLMRILPYRTTENVIDGVSITFSDITILKNTLKDKEILIKDIHHRVKNNMTLLVSILGLEKMKLAKREDVSNVYLETIDNVIGRINILCQIYTKLYQSEKGLESVDSKIFFMDLLDLIRSSYQDTEEIKLFIDIDDVFLPFEKVVPLGLIVNELITNSLKYAFILSKTGEIIFSLRKENNNIHLQIKDNGQGITDDINKAKSKSLGLLLVESLVEQIKGSIKIKNDCGICVDIVFKV